MKFLEFFDRIYVINLPYRVDRRKAIEKELNQAGISFLSEKVELFAAIRPDSAGSFRSIGYRGAFLSHLNVLKQAREQGLNNVLIIEDDLELSEDFKKYEDLLIAELMVRDWDIVHFGYGIESIASAREVSLPILQPFSGEMIGAQFYGVNGKVLGRLIDFFEALLQRPAGHPEGGPMSPDGAYNFFRWQNPDVVRLIAVPSFGGQRSSRSDITPSWFDRLPILRFLARVAREIGLVGMLKNFSFLKQTKRRKP
ncbi:LPS biosynthesis glycosyltransferase [Hydrococcus rivularis NIES-593]|uniref:LPS biosynthesis glycosyltransferase n=1 Tax=Hydrococcus rivularis NIES-593 TaxID=1921803 RepID=A0A1U7HRK8_9CYAN|nr:glycosyltransferase family 25 protein [Hydrococcus rivularis]OKH26165.1 LPS biosynthesis glycosyltransferase [Hydrococcus rivularis NIES-593]